MTFEGLRQAGLPNSAHLSAGGGGANRYKGSSINYIITFGGLSRIIYLMLLSDTDKLLSV